MNRLEYTCIILLLKIVSLINCNKISAFYTIVPGMDRFGNSLECLLQIAQETSVIKYGNLDGSCEILDFSWQSNPSYDAGYIYSWVNAYERPFEEALRVFSPFPNNFQENSGFEVVFRTGAVVSAWVVINVCTPDKSDLIVHCNIRPDQNRTAFDSRIGGGWVDDIFLPNPVTTPNTVYRVTVIYRTTEWEFYVNNEYFYTFTNRHTFNGSGYVEFESTEVYCQKIIYYHPS